MKSLTDLVKSCADERAGATEGGDNQRAQDRMKPAEGRLRRVAQTGLWQDVEFVPKIVEKVGE